MIKISTLGQWRVYGKSLKFKILFYKLERWTQRERGPSERIADGAAEAANSLDLSDFGNRETLAAKVVLTHSLNIYTLCKPNRLDSIRGASAESLCDDETNSESNEMTAKEWNTCKKRVEFARSRRGVPDNTTTEKPSHSGRSGDSMDEL